MFKASNVKGLRFENILFTALQRISLKKLPRRRINVDVVTIHLFFEPSADIVIRERKYISQQMPSAKLLDYSFLKCLMTTSPFIFLLCR